MADLLVPSGPEDGDFYAQRGFPDGASAPAGAEGAAEDPWGRTRVLRERDYRISLLPVVADPSAADDPIGLRSLVYREGLQAWRQLTEVRFKLLGFLPAVSVLAFIQLADLPADESTLATWARAWVALVGLLVTVGLSWYDRRNDALYDDLLSRVRRAEMELGIHTGVMLGRLVGEREFRHGPAVSLIYYTVIGSWAAAFGLLLGRAIGAWS